MRNREEPEELPPALPEPGRAQIHTHYSQPIPATNPDEGSTFFPQPKGYPSGIQRSACRDRGTPGGLRQHKPQKEGREREREELERRIGTFFFRRCSHSHGGSFCEDFLRIWEGAFYHIIINKKRKIRPMYSDTHRSHASPTFVLRGVATSPAPQLGQRLLPLPPFSLRTSIQLFLGADATQGTHRNVTATLVQTLPVI